MNTKFKRTAFILIDILIDFLFEWPQNIETVVYI